MALVITLAQAKALASEVPDSCPQSFCLTSFPGLLKSQDPGSKNEGIETKKAFLFSFTSGFETFLCSWITFSKFFCHLLCKGTIRVCAQNSDQRENVNVVWLGIKLDWQCWAVVLPYWAKSSLFGFAGVQKRLSSCFEQSQQSHPAFLIAIWDEPW